jgi:hypothetical protein
MYRLRSKYPLALVLVVASLASPAAAQPTFLEITYPVAGLGLTPRDVARVTTYAWQTFEGGTDPAEVRFVLLSTIPFGNSYLQTLNYLRTVPNAPEWSPWMPYSPPDVGTSWTSPEIDYGNYIFAVQGRDALGETELLIEPRNAARITITLRESGPLLTVTGDLIDPIVTSVTSTPLTEITVGAGTEIVFCWTADASTYGGVVDGYRYQWDMTDPDDENQWETGFIPFPSPSVCSAPEEFFAGDHLFHVEVIDNAGYKSRVPILVHVLPTTPVEQATWGRVKALYAAEHSQP